MPGRLGPRFALEAGFLILLAVAMGLAQLDAITIVIVMAVAWFLVAVIEWLASRDAAATVPGRWPTPPPEPWREAEAVTEFIPAAPPAEQAAPEPAPELDPEPDVVPEVAPEPDVVPEPEPEPEAEFEAPVEADERPEPPVAVVEEAPARRRWWRRGDRGDETGRDGG